VEDAACDGGGLVAGDLAAAEHAGERDPEQTLSIRPARRSDRDGMRRRRRSSRRRGRA
jgi:hypothetical protein